MIKAAAIGAWVCAVTSVAAFQGTQALTVEGGAPTLPSVSMSKMVQVKVKPLHVPLISGDQVTGYIVCQIVILAGADTLKKLVIKPDIFVLDAAYTAIYGRDGPQQQMIGRDRWPQFAKSIKDAVNARYGIDVVADLLIEEFGYVPADQARKPPSSQPPSDSSASRTAIEKKRLGP
jgi:hypothetical protein